MKRLKKLRRPKLPSKKITGLVVIAIILLIVFVSGKAYLYRSDYFSLKTVETRGVFLDSGAITSINSQLLNLYKGTNVFRMNLKGIAASLGRSYPDAKEIVARIVLPDKLAISIKFRRPIAVVRNGKSYPIDEDGFVLPSVEVDPLKDLPVIEGANVLYDERRSRQSPSKNLIIAIELLQELKKSRAICRYGLVSINAKDLGDLSFYLKNGIEVRMGYENFPERVAALEGALGDTRLALERIKYIDVRFKDVVIGPK